MVSQNQLILTCGDILLLEVVEGREPEERTSGNGHDQKERCVVIEQTLVLFSSSAEAVEHPGSARARSRREANVESILDIVWVPVVLHPALFDLVDGPSSALLSALQDNIDILRRLVQLCS